ncbi:uncharacterized protein LOC131670513 [Phymastichus coffea]|uniref:uncharacterized protein LOC131670513 n=1 Tax=Phymastichus coffea TaxID=108790 RepID=UPI00273ABCFA|nr:uncharacterized protein LOC131670513 [Phymastichus coffea]
MSAPQLTTSTKKYWDLKDKTVRAEYVWVNFSNHFWKIFSKTRNLDSMEWSAPIFKSAKIPRWNFEDLYNSGSLQPAVNFDDPFRPKHSYITLCETFLEEEVPMPFTRYRKDCRTKATVARLDGHYFHIEQEFHFEEYANIELTIAHKDVIRKVLDCFYKAANYAGLCICSFNLRNNRLFKYVTGPSNALRVCDELWMSRFIFQRVAEEFHLTPCFGPLISGDVAHNTYIFSSFNMREGSDQEAMGEAQIWLEGLQTKFTRMMRSSIIFDERIRPSPTYALFDNKGRTHLELKIACDIDPYVVTKSIIMAASSIEFNVQNT